MSDVGGRQTGCCIIDCSRLDTVSKRMLYVFLAVWRV